VRWTPASGSYRAALSLLLACILAGCSTLGRPVAEVPSLPTPTPPPAVPLPPTNIEAIPDPVPRFEPRSAHGNPPFYDVLGRRYFVLGDAEGYVERGVASWYGPTFHGVNTSSGEPYDMYGMTAAHKTLPLPAYARVTNLRNGRTVVVRINDRGPFVANRLIDLSYTAAAKLDMIRDGTALVEVRVLVPSPGGGTQSDPITRAALSPPPTLYIQAGAFSSESNAQHLLKTLRAAGLTDAFVLSRPEPRHLFRVRVGPVTSVSEFDALAARLAKLGIPDARLAVD